MFRWKKGERESERRNLVDMINCFFQGVNLMINSLLKHKLMWKNNEIEANWEIDGNSLKLKRESFC